MRYVEVPTDSDVTALELALWVRWAAERRAVYESWASLPDDQVPAWYVRVGRPAPPTPNQGLDWNVARGRWVWHTGTCPGVELLRINGGGAVARVGARWAGVTGSVDMADAFDPLIVAADNLSEIYGAKVPCARARLALGLDVEGQRAARGAAFDLGAVSVIERGQVTGRYASKLDELEAADLRAARARPVTGL